MRRSRSPGTSTRSNPGAGEQPRMSAGSLRRVPEACGHPSYSGVDHDQQPVGLGRHRSDQRLGNQFGRQCQRIPLLPGGRKNGPAVEIGFGSVLGLPSASVGSLLADGPRRSRRRRSSRRLPSMLQNQNEGPVPPPGRPRHQGLSAALLAPRHVVPLPPTARLPPPIRTESMASAANSAKALPAGMAEIGDGGHAHACIHRRFDGGVKSGSIAGIPCPPPRRWSELTVALCNTCLAAGRHIAAPELPRILQDSHDTVGFNPTQARFY